MNNVLTASRMNCLSRCPRAHYWQYEIGLRKLQEGLALAIGSAMHRGFDVRWKGGSYEDALAAAIPEGIALDPYTLAKIAAMLAAYYDVYGVIETAGRYAPEVQFSFDLKNGFTSEGKMDNLGFLDDNRQVLFESKTTGASIDEFSDYWLRLSFNLQIYQYVCAARDLGWQLDTVYYDVVRKPQLKPWKEIVDLDEQGRKIVVDKDGKRVFLTAGKNKGEPRQTGEISKGYAVKVHAETPNEYCDRIWRDATTRSGFYFCRREIPVLDDVVEQFKLQRLAMAQMILHFREHQAFCAHPEDAWPRNVSEHNCKFCDFRSFCLQDLRIDLDTPPPGLAIKKFNPELEHELNITTEENDDAAAAAY